MKTCPDFSLLSQFLDHELGEEEQAKIAQHLDTCAECHAKTEHVRRTEETARTESSRSPSRLSLQAPSQECLSPAVVTAYVQRSLTAVEGERAENHLQTCDKCMQEIMEAFRITASLTATQRIPVPATLKTRVAALWERPPAVTQAFSRLVIQIAQKGLKLLEQHLVPPLLDVQEMLAPMPAYRAEEGATALDLAINAGQTQIRATAVPEGDGVALKLTFLGAAREVLAGQRVFVRQQGRSIFSAKTDKNGVLRTPRLAPGTYKVACSGLDATFELELRP